MGRQLTGFAVGLGMLTFASGAWAQPAARPETARPEMAQLRVLVVNLVGARPEIVQAAERDASAIYAASGVRTLWVDPAPVGTPNEGVDLTVVLSPEPAAEAKDITETTLGVAVTDPNAPGQRGRLVWVFFDRVEAHAYSSHIEISRLCGLVMAHEIGHLVLPPGHSGNGLMRASWHLRPGPLQYFTNDQTAAMQARIAQARADLTGRN